MTQNSNNLQNDIINYSVKILCAWLKNNPCKVEDISSNLNIIHASVSDNIRKMENKNMGNDKIDIQNTVFDDYIICLEDGKKLKMLKRHLWSKYKMSVEDYKKKWGLGFDYPAVAPSYAKKRSEIARNISKS